MDDAGIKRKSVSEVFREAFPYYMAMGMTYEQYWEMDSSLVIAYRKADRIRAERENYSAWLQGRYVYDALCCASPIFHDLAKPGTKAKPYMEKPYEFRPVKPDKDEKERMKNNGLMAMQNIAARFNKAFREREAKKLNGETGQRK